MKTTFAIFIILFLFKSVNAQYKKDGVKSPYTSLIIKDKTISMLGKQVDLNTDGLPAMIQTFFNPEMTDSHSAPKNLVTEPIHFHITRLSNHKDIKWKSEGITFKERKPKVVSWAAKNMADSLSMEINGTIKFDGSLSYIIKITALNDINLDNIRLHIPFTDEASKYIKSPGQKEMIRPDLVDRKWDGTNKKDSNIWIGDVNGGLQYVLKNNKHDSSSWSNGGKGGIHIAQKGKSILADNYSGEHRMKKGDVLYYNFTLLITPAYLDAESK